jgi:uncharacterized RmlC-like cupin family protein
MAAAKREDNMPNTAEKSACTVMRAHEPYVGKQGFSYAPAISAETVGAKGLHMQLITVPG